jgi:hypothetical protein
MITVAKLDFHLSGPWSLLLAAATTLGACVSHGQANSDVTIHISLLRQTCLVGSADVPCSDVGAKLRDQGTPQDAHIHLIFDTSASPVSLPTHSAAVSAYQTVSAALTSLSDAGFRFKLGYVNVRADGER